MSNLQTNKVIDNTKILEGMKIVYDTVKQTLGPCGRNVIIQTSEFDVPYITNDGVTIARSIVLDDEELNAGALLLKESSIKTNEVVGDGTTTTVILAYNIIAESLKNINGIKQSNQDGSKNASFNVTKFIKYLKEYSSEISTILDENSKEASSYDDIKNVATISSNDKYIGEIVADAIDKSNGLNSILIADSNLDETFIDKCDGYKWNNGLLSPFMANDVNKYETELKNVAVLIIDQNLNNVPILFKSILEPLAKNGVTDVLIVCQGASDDVLYALMVNKAKINVVLVKPDCTGERKVSFLSDLEVIIKARGITSIDKLGEINILNHLGSVSTAKINRKSTTLIGYNDPEFVSAYANELLQSAELLEDTDSNKDLLIQRANKLLDKIVTIKVGAVTENELKEKKFRIEDAVNASLAAKENGISKGCGLAFIDALKSFQSSYEYKVKNNKEEYENNIESNLAANILLYSLDKPFLQNLANANIINDNEFTMYSYDSAVLKNIMDELDKNKFSAFDTENNDIVPNAFEAGIIDPTKVLKESIKNAVSVASLIITTNSAIIYIPKSDSE